MTVMQAKYGLLSINRNNSPFDFPYQSSDVEQVKKMEAQKSLAPRSKARGMFGIIRRS